MSKKIEFGVLSLVMLVFLALQLVHNNMFLKTKNVEPQDYKYEFKVSCPLDNHGPFKLWCDNVDYTRYGTAPFYDIVNPLYGFITIIS